MTEIIVKAKNGVYVRTRGCIIDPLSDIVFSHEFEGCFNVSALNRDRHLFEILRYPITENIIESNSKQDVSEIRVDEIPLAIARRVPGIMIENKNKTVFLADGNHRLRKLIQYGDSSALCYFVPYAQRHNYEQKTSISFDGKTWREISSFEDLVLSWGHFEHHSQEATKELKDELASLIKEITYDT